MTDIEEEEPSQSQPKKKRRNQYLPAPPEDDLNKYITHYWKLGFHDEGIARQCMDHFDINEYGLTKWTVQRRRKALCLKGTRQQAATWEEIHPIYLKLRAKFPNMGARAMVTTIRQDYGIKVPEALLAAAFKAVEPEEVKRRKRKRFQRKRFWSAGVMDILAFDQHDKWKRFGLWLHVGLDPFPGRIAWLKIWWTNRNPKLITSYYINACRLIGGIPLVTQSDPGSENYGIANCQTVTRQRLDRSLEGTLQHRWMNKKAMNVKPEALWSVLRRNFTPGFEDLLDVGVNSGLYRVDNALEKLVLRWLAIPWLQRELDAWVQRYNGTARRADKHKILPQGIPDLIASKPEQFGTKDYKVLVTPDLFDEMETTWAPPDDPVFKLTPDTFDEQATFLYAAIGSPDVNHDSLWIVFSQLLNAFLDVPAIADATFEEAVANADDHFEVPDMELLANQRELRHGDAIVGSHGYMGGLDEPPVDEDEDEDEDEVESNVDPREYAVFSDDDGDE